MSALIIAVVAFILGYILNREDGMVTYLILLGIFVLAVGLYGIYS